MTEKRKKLQVKLRRKYGYSTNTNYNRGAIFIKPPLSAETDYLNFILANTNENIYICHGDKYIGRFTFEEIETLYEAMMEFRKEKHE